MDLSRASVTRWLVVLVTGVGLVAMHSLMSVPGPHLASSGVSVSSSGRPDATASPLAEPMGEQPMGEQPMGAPGQPPGHDHHHGSMLGHLCLAVLAALGLVLLAPLLFRTLRRRPVAPVRPAGPDSASSAARSPPPTPRRLAQLCVSRR